MATVYSPFVNELKEKMEFEGTFLAKVVQLHWDKNGKPYLNLVLMDRTGEVEARAWDQAVRWSEEIKPHELVRIAGKVNLFQNRRQIIVEAAAKVAEGSLPMDRFIPSTVYDTSRMMAELEELFQTLGNPGLKALALTALKDPELRPKFLRAPAAKTVHHAYAGGLLEHCLSVCRILDLLATHYRSYYGPALDRDLMLVGGLFHDFGKIEELSFQRGTEYTKAGQLIGHHVLACALIDRLAPTLSDPLSADHLLLVKHMVLAHHGKLEYGSPKVPHTIEAYLVHAIDDLDSKVNSILLFTAADQSSNEWTSVHRLFERPFLKPAVKAKISGSSPGRE
jgi:3'-5' exoribonuclease